MPLQKWIRSRLRRLVLGAAAFSLALGCASILTAVATANPALASGSYDNSLIAATALKYVGQWGGNACRDAGKLDANGTTVGGYGAGQCRTFVNCVVYLASGRTQYPVGPDYFTSFANAGGTEITDINNLTEGDIVQSGQGTHTFIIVSRVSVSGASGTFNVVDSNHNNDEKVMTYQRTFSLSSSERAFRMGTVMAPPPPPIRTLTETGAELWENVGASSWVLLSGTASVGNWQAVATRVGLLDGNGLWLKDGTNGWARIGEPTVQEFQVSPARVLARVANGLWEYSGNGFYLISDTAAAGNWQLSGDRVGLLDGNGLWIKDGDGPFVQVAGNDVQEFQVSPTMIVARVGSNLYANTGGGFTLISDTASAGNWKLFGNRIVLLDSNGLWLKDGTSGWARIGEPTVQEFQVSATRVLARVANGLWEYSGSGFTLISDTASAGNWQLVGDTVALADSNGLWIKDGDGAFNLWAQPGFDQFQIAR
jgi:hypothetical protein